MLADGPLPDKAMKMQHPHLLDTKHWSPWKTPPFKRARPPLFS
jgi:hypothetical protein